MCAINVLFISLGNVLLQEKIEHRNSGSARRDAQGNLSRGFSIVCAHFKMQHIKVSVECAICFSYSHGSGGLFRIKLCAICKFSGAERSLWSPFFVNYRLGAV